MSTTFVVSSSPPALKEVLTVLRPYTTDINGNVRTSFSPGENVYFWIGVYSTFGTPVSGTVRFQLFTSSGIAILDVPAPFSFTPGVSGGFVGIGTPQTIPADTYTFTTIVTGGGASSSASTTIVFAGGPAPTVSSSLQPMVRAESGNASFVSGGLGKVTASVHNVRVNDAEESLKQQ
jgi:hypothetical protein